MASLISLKNSDISVFVDGFLTTNDGSTGEYEVLSFDRTYLSFLISKIGIIIIALTL